MEKNINIVRFVIRTKEENEPAYLVAIGEDGREYEWSSRVYVHGEEHGVDILISQGCANCGRNDGEEANGKCNNCGC